MVTAHGERLGRPRANPKNLQISAFVDAGSRGFGLLPLVFFFQAEDGIRDWSVTGVQTCALPIYSSGADPWARRGAEVQDHIGRDQSLPRRGPRVSGGSRRLDHARLDLSGPDRREP